MFRTGWLRILKRTDCISSVGYEEANVTMGDSGIGSAAVPEKSVAVRAVGRCVGTGSPEVWTIYSHVGENERLLLRRKIAKS